MRCRRTARGASPGHELWSVLVPRKTEIWREGGRDKERETQGKEMERESEKSSEVAGKQDSGVDRLRPTQTDSDRLRQTQTEADRRRQTKTHSDRLNQIQNRLRQIRQTQTNSDRLRQTQTDLEAHRTLPSLQIHPKTYKRVQNVTARYNTV